ncbi:cytochrome P450 [Stereum hirsutum FP-91666 SS1]|uniref:cytochrome P450 n=1 Tax=Stereum hirsutum (strain FP-91666) TaxID=721885 RepID=UPI0004449376|nr:cytochrome P450 [Stereum hirsutum FP-91666 SS1]EIM84927.1 cytochrome P450 [Stereum hirsutum FP-91666 SS1]
MSQVLLGLFSLPILGGLFLLLRAIRHWVRQAHLRAVVPGPARTSLVAGNLKQLFNLDAWGFLREIATYGKVVRILGLFGDTQLYVSDPKALHHILVKDRYIYDETDMFITSNSLVFGMGLLSTRGEHHRKQRKLLNPVFSIKHMRYMLPIFHGISHQLCDVFQKKIASGTQEIDVLDWMTRVALELVGQGGLGYSFESLDENSSNLYGNAMKDFVPTVASIQLIRQLLPWFSNIGTPTFRRYIAQNLPFKRLNRLVELSDIMDETSNAILSAKRKALEKGDDAVVHQVGEGRDIMSILMKANMEASEEDRLPDSELTAQMSTLIFAAMDTTSNALSRIIHTLSENQDAQDKLRAELIKARKEADGDLDYDTLHELPYMEAVCRETLRLYPPVLHMFRTTRKDVVLPLGTPIATKDSLLSELFIPENTNVIVGIKAVNCDETIWGPDANEWKPERWLGPLPESVTSAGIPGVYSNTLTFLGGGRACIGFKFSQLEMKVVLALLISTFRFSPGKTKYSFKSSNIVTPMVNGKPGMPLHIELA